MHCDIAAFFMCRICDSFSDAEPNVTGSFKLLEWDVNTVKIEPEFSQIHPESLLFSSPSDTLGVKNLCPFVRTIG